MVLARTGSGTGALNRENEICILTFTIVLHIPDPKSVRAKVRIQLSGNILFVIAASSAESNLRAVRELTLQPAWVKNPQ